MGELAMTPGLGGWLQSPWDTAGVLAEWSEEWPVTPAVCWLSELRKLSDASSVLQKSWLVLNYSKLYKLTFTKCYTDYPCHPVQFLLMFCWCVTELQVIVSVWSTIVAMSRADGTWTNTTSYHDKGFLSELHLKRKLFVPVKCDNLIGSDVNRVVILLIFTVWAWYCSKIYPAIISRYSMWILLEFHEKILYRLCFIKINHWVWKFSNNGFLCCIEAVPGLISLSLAGYIVMWIPWLNERLSLGVTFIQQWSIDRDGPLSGSAWWSGSTSWCHSWWSRTTRSWRRWAFALKTIT